MSVFTTGAHLEPRQLANGRWAWVVVEFEDDTFKDGPLFDTPRGSLGEDDYHQHAEQWGKELGIEPYTLHVAVYQAQNGHVVITIQGNPNVDILVMAEAAEHDGFDVQGRTPQAKLISLRQLEEIGLFTTHMQDVPLGQVYDSEGHEFKAAPVSQDTLRIRVDRDITRPLEAEGVTPDQFHEMGV
jgi:hypothetical protein